MAIVRPLQPRWYAIFPMLVCWVPTTWWHASSRLPSCRLCRWSWRTTSKKNVYYEAFLTFSPRQQQQQPSCRRQDGDVSQRHPHCRCITKHRDQARTAETAENGTCSAVTHLSAVTFETMTVKYDGYSVDWQFCICWRRSKILEVVCMSVKYCLILLFIFIFH